MRFVVVLALLSLALSAGPLGSPQATAAADQPVEWSFPGGYFFTQAGVKAGKGFPVVDDDQARMMTEYFRLGGDMLLGYPISERYEVDGLVHQAFQRAVLRWRPESGQVEFVSVFNEISGAGKDVWLLNTYRVPLPANWSADAGRSPQEIEKAHVKLLDADPEMKAFFFAQENPVAVYGLPMSAPVDQGSNTIMRLEKAVFQKWKQDFPWAVAGTVTTALSGDMARAAGVIPADAARPVSPQEALGGERWIGVSLAEQKATAYVGLHAVYVAVVSTGVPGMETPKGNWRIYYRVANETMDSRTIGIPREDPNGYYLKDVLYTQYFAPSGVALHYNYWTPASQFGQRAGSHGCVGLQHDDALFMWEFGETGMKVLVYE